MSRPSQIASSVGVPAPGLRAQSASGAVVVLEDGREYLDLMNGKGSVTLGHHHPEVAQALITSLHSKSGCGTCWSDSFEALAEMIVADSGLPDGQIAFFSTGTEACRAAVQCARRASGKKLVASAGYHGWDDLWSSGSGWLQPNAHGVIDFYFIPELLEQVLARHRDQVALVMVSPDYVHLRPDTLASLVRLARERDVLFCSDDVKNGYRSTVASALPGLIGEAADLYTFSKGLANGHRLSCLVGRPELMRKARHMTYTAYFDPLPIAAALATLRHMRRERGYERLCACGAELARRLRVMIAAACLPIKVLGDGPLLQFVGASEMLDEALYEACGRHGLLLYSFDNQAVSLAVEDVLPELEVRFGRVFDELAETFGGALRGLDVTPQRQFEAAFGMIDGATDAFPARDAIRWLEELQA